LINSEWRGEQNNGDSRIYGPDGRLRRIEYANGLVTNLEYNDNDKLTRVSDHYGNVLIFTYEEDLISSVNLPDNSVVHYGYDANKNLTSVIYPDLTPDPNDNASLFYHYEDARFLHHLTGITDENGSRYATFAYDANGKAITSELGVTSHPVGQQKIQLDYQGNP